MRILFINNNGSGYADYLQIDAGTTVKALFEQQIPKGNPSHYLIRVDRQPASADQLLKENDRVSITPLKIEGAH